MVTFSLHSVEDEVIGKSKQNRNIFSYRQVERQNDIFKFTVHAEPSWLVIHTPVS